jgi:DNA transformation protein
MKKDDGFLAYVLDQLRLLRNVEARAMFGGYGLYRDGSFFGIISKGRFYMRTSPLTRPNYVKAGTKPFRPSVRQTLRSYYEVPQEVLDDASTLARWVEEAASGV